MNDASGPRREIRIVGDHDDGRAALVQIVQQGHHAGGGGGVQIAGWLVREQEARRANQGSGNRDPLLLATGELRRQVAHAAAQTHPIQNFGYTLFAFRRAHAAIAQRHVHVVEDAEFGDQVETLKHEADLLAAQLRAGAVVQIRNVFAIEPVGSALVAF